MKVEKTETYLFDRSRRSPRGGKLPFFEGSNSDGVRFSGMSGGGNNEANNKGNVSNSSDAANTESTATSSNSTVPPLATLPLRTNPFENFSVAVESERTYQRVRIF